jgi:hypothetical protein
MRAAIAGIALVVVHAIAFVALADRARGTELAVDTVTGTVDGDDVTASSDGDGPGLRRRAWTVHYRGDVTRQVAATTLQGPFQEPRACSGRVVMGQRLLDQTTPVMAKQIDAQLQGEQVFPIGDYKKLDHLALTWAELGAHPEDAFVGAAPHGYVRITATLQFSRVAIPLTVALVPEYSDAGVFWLPARHDQLHFRIETKADLAFDNRVFQWVSDKLDIAALATRLARSQIDDLLVTTLAPPPPFDLGGKQQLVFTYCAGPVEIKDGAWGALPFGVAFDKLAAAPDLRPPHFAPGTHAAPSKDTMLAIDLDVDALDAMLFELWRTGWLDARLDEAGLDRAFNTDPFVTTFLSLRLSPLRLALPPVIEPATGALRLAADARVTIADGDERTVGRVFGAATLHVASLEPAVDLAQLELACEKTPTTLVPCYADLVAAIADRGAEFHGALTDNVAKLVKAIFVDRSVPVPGTPAELAIRGATMSLAPDARGLHLDLDAAVR